jgi:transposase InsO family protein
MGTQLIPIAPALHLLAQQAGCLWPTKAAAKLAVDDWIERVYNRRRRHSAIGMISPVDFEDQLTRSAQAA